MAPYGEARIKFDPWTPMRLAEPFERLRDKSDDLLTRTGVRPKVFLANFGTAADFTARATFARSFFDSGGIEAIDYEGFDDPAPSPPRSRLPARSASASARPTGSMPGRPLLPPRPFTQAGAKHIYLAGRPGEQEAALRDAAVGDFIFAGGDALATLRDAYRLIGET